MLLIAIILLRPMTDFLANNTCLKALCLTALLSTPLSTFLSTTIPFTEYTIVLSLEEERARK
jgi:hypothetical protein